MFADRDAALNPVPAVQLYLFTTSRLFFSAPTHYPGCNVDDAATRFAIDRITPAMDTIDFPDEFEEYRARARSGGSLFGLLRRDAGQDDLLCPPPQRQRSRSLVPRSAPLETDQDVLRALYESTLEPEPCRRDPLDLCVPNKNNNKRSSPEKNHRTPSLDDEDDDEGCSMASKCRDRGYSLPVIISPHVERDTLKPPELASITGSRDGLAYRRRSFSTTPKGIKNDGDLLVSGTLSTASSIASDIHIDVNGRSRASSSNSQESCSANVSGKPAYKVLMLGGPGVGKTALTQQFMTSEYVGAQNTSFGKSIYSLLTCLRHCSNIIPRHHLKMILPAFFAHGLLLKCIRRIAL